MKLRNIFILFVFVITALFSLTTFTTDAEARAGSGTSSGSRGSRSYSRPASPTTTAPQAQRPYAAPPQAPQSASGGFFRSMAGGIVGGMLGGMLFRSMGFAGAGGAGGGGIGLFEIILIGGIIYLIYRFIKKKREEEAMNQGNVNTFEPQYQQQSAVAYEAPRDDVEAGLSHIRQMDYNFDEQRFNDNVMDIFFKIQGAWMNRDLTSAGALLTAQMRQTFQNDIDQMIRDKKINRLENIAVRNVEVVEAWQEAGQDYITTLIYANLLDYTTDESNQVISGSKSDPVKFEEYWTFTRPVGSNPWQLSAIQQK